MDVNLYEGMRYICIDYCLFSILLKPCSVSEWKRVGRLIFVFCERDSGGREKCALTFHAFSPINILEVSTRVSSKQNII